MLLFQCTARGTDGVLVAALASLLLTSCAGDDGQRAAPPNVFAQSVAAPYDTMEPEAPCPGPNSDSKTPYSGSAEAAFRAKAALGEALFNDRTLSASGTASCASCHDQASAFTGNNRRPPLFPVSEGAFPELLGTRNAPSALYASFSPPFGFVEEAEEPGEFTPTGGQFWDGRARDLAEQAEGPFLNAREMALPDKAAVVSLVRQAPYREQFLAVYGTDALDDVDQAYGQIGDAIASFEQTDTFAPFSSRFDAFLRGQVELSDLEQHGLDLFLAPDKGNCIACHAGDPDSRTPSDWLFTDFTYDNLGVPRNAQIPDNERPEFVDLGLCEQPGLWQRVPPAVADKDAFVSGLCGAFKVPTLRNVAVTAPYMHNGYFRNLRDVVDFYVTRGPQPERWYPKSSDGKVQLFDDLPVEYHQNVNVEEVPYDRKPGEEPRLSPDEIDAVVAFLETLTDGYRVP